MSLDGKTLLVVSGGYEGKRRAYERLAELGARLVMVDEPGHWSHDLLADGVLTNWLPTTVIGDSDADAQAVLGSVAAAGVKADGVVTYWEDSVCVVSRVAEALGLPGNPKAAVDAARSKVRTRELSAQLGLPTPKARRVRSLDELFAAASYVGFPAVVKPEFGASAVGCVRVDNFETLPDVYSLVRSVVSPEADDIFRAGNDLLLEEYLDGVEFDVDVVMHNGTPVFTSVSQNWPTAEPSFQEKGLHCPPDHDKREVARLVDLVHQTVKAFGLHRGVLHVEGKCTTRGPRIIEVNARMGGGRVWDYVSAVWDVDLVVEHARACLDLGPTVKPSRRPRCAVVDVIVHAPSNGTLTSLPVDRTAAASALRLDVDMHAEVGEHVRGPEAIFATMLMEVSVMAKSLKHARALAADVVRQPPLVAATSNAF